MRTALIVLLAVALPSTAFAGCPGKFVSLLKYAGESPDRFLQEPVIRSRMRELMGPAQARLETSLSVRGPVALIGCNLVVEGNAPHQGGERGAILSFNVHTGQMTVGMLEQGQVTIVSPEATDSRFHYSWVPAHVRDWAFVAADAFRSRIKQPMNVAVAPSYQDR
jgi:hypothetical protein